MCPDAFRAVAIYWNLPLTGLFFPISPEVCTFDTVNRSCLYVYSSLMRAVQVETVGGAVATERKRNDGRKKRDKGCRNVDLFKRQKGYFWWFMIRVISDG